LAITDVCVGGLGGTAAGGGLISLELLVRVILLLAFPTQLVVEKDFFAPKLRVELGMFTLFGLCVGQLF
jgi:hypothetical protein